MAKARKWFTCSYPFQGRAFSVHIEAVDAAEASRRLRAIGTNGSVDGELVAEFNAYPDRSIRKFVRKLRALFRGLEND